MGFKSINDRLDTLSNLSNCVTLPSDNIQYNAMKHYNEERILETHYSKYGELKLDGGGRYWGYIPTESGKKVIRKTRREDIEKIILSLPEYKELKAVKNSFKDIFLDVFQYEKELDVLRPTTIHRLETSYKRFFTNNTNTQYGKIIENSQINKIRIKDLERFFADCVNKLNPKEKLKKKAFNCLWDLLNKVFDYAYREDLIKENYLKRIDKKKFFKQCTAPSYEQQHNIILTPDLQKLLQEIQSRHMAENKTTTKLQAEVKLYAVELICYLGLRPAEVSGLQKSDIHFMPEHNGIYGELIIQHSMKEGKNGYELSTTKTGKTRTIPIDEKVKKVLDGIEQLNKINRRRYKDFLFLEYTGKTRPISPKSIGSCLTRLCEDIKIKPISPTVLRKSFNSRLKLNGVSSLVCSSILGNSVQVNDNHYTYDGMSTNEDKINSLKVANLKL